MGRQPGNGQKKHKEQRKSAKELPQKDFALDDMAFSDNSSNLGDTKLNVPEDDLPVPNFGQKKTGYASDAGMDFDRGSMP